MNWTHIETKWREMAQRLQTVAPHGAADSATSVKTGVAKSGVAKTGAAKNGRDERAVLHAPERQAAGQMDGRGMA